MDELTISNEEFQAKLDKMSTLNNENPTTPSPKKPVAQGVALKCLYKEHEEYQWSTLSQPDNITRAQQIETDKAVLGVTFKGQSPGKMYKVAVDNNNSLVDITAPRLSYIPRYASSDNNIEKHHYANCRDPEYNEMNETTIPYHGCFDYLLYDKRYIKYSHSILNGKINFWRMECLKQFRKSQIKCEKSVHATHKQQEFALVRAGFIQKMIGEYEGPDISVLNLDGIRRLVLRWQQHSDDEPKLIFEMSKCNSFQLILDKGTHEDDFDLITRFDRENDTDYCFGKPQYERVRETLPTSENTSKKRARDNST